METIEMENQRHKECLDRLKAELEQLKQDQEKYLESMEKNLNSDTYESSFDESRNSANSIGNLQRIEEINSKIELEEVLHNKNLRDLEAQKQWGSIEEAEEELYGKSR